MSGVDPLRPFESGRSFGSQFTAKRMNDILTYIRSTTLNTGGGYRGLRRTSGGTTVDFKRFPGIRRTTHPYQGFDASAGPIPGVTVIYGDHQGPINSFVPTINGTPLVVNPTVDDPAPILVLGNSDTAVYVQIDFDITGIITSASIHSTSSGVPQNVVNDDLSATGYELLFGVSITFGITGNATVATADGVTASQGCRVCGVGIDFWGLG